MLGLLLDKAFNHLKIVVLKVGCLVVVFFSNVYPGKVGLWQIQDVPIRSLVRLPLLPLCYLLRLMDMIEFAIAIEFAPRNAEVSLGFMRLF